MSLRRLVGLFVFTTSSARGLVWLLLTTSTVGLAAETLRLDVSEALALAAAHSPTLAGRRAAVDAAEHRVSATTARMLPRLSLNVRYTRLSYVKPGEITLPFSLPNQPPPDPIQLGDVIENQFASSVVLEQPIFTGLSLLNTREAAQHVQEAAADQLLQEQQDLALRTEEAYFGLFRARQLLTVTEQSLKALTAHLERLERLAREGATTPLDVSRTRTRLAGTRVQQLQTRAAEAVAQQGLLTLLGLEADVVLELTQDLEHLPPPSEGDLQAQANVRPDLRAARAAAAAKEAQARAAGGGLWPQVALRAAAQFDSPNQRYFPLRNEFNPSWDASVVLSWTAWDWLATWHTQRAAQLDALAARHAIAQLEDGVRTEVERRRLEAATAVERKAASLEAVEVAEQSLQRAQRLCDAGQAPCIGVLDAEAELTALRAEWVQSRIDLRLAASQLRRAIGTLSLTPEGKP
jgi:outer membrane protein TolC